VLRDKKSWCLCAFSCAASFDQVETIWNKVFEAGAAFGIKPVGLAARDTLRLEMGFAFTMTLTIPPHR
jgi:glycine cleavage system aminomethyltransferase T